MFNPGFDIRPDFHTMDFIYGESAFGPITEKRLLIDIRKSLSNPNTEGPEIVYSVAMDVGKIADREDLIRRNLLYGAMIYAKGRMGKEPVRSQGHIHAVSPSCGTSTPEVYEIWSGNAIIYMQETTENNPGRCYAIQANAGDVVIVPEGWVHCTINADQSREMTFGAWCVRDYGFDYQGVRAHGGIAYYPKYNDNGNIVWERNLAYTATSLKLLAVPDYSGVGLRGGIPIYRQYEANHDLFNFVKDPSGHRGLTYFPE